MQDVWYVKGVETLRLGSFVLPPGNMLVLLILPHMETGSEKILNFFLGLD